MISATALRRCLDYDVESPDGHIGTVAEIRYAGDQQTPTALAIRAGRASSRLLIVPVSQLVAIRAHRHEVTLRPSPRVTTSEKIPGPG
jgi:hypothetical protein